MILQCRLVRTGVSEVAPFVVGQTITSSLSQAFPITSFQPGNESELRGKNQIRMWGSQSIKGRVKEASKLKTRVFKNKKSFDEIFVYDYVQAELARSPLNFCKKLYFQRNTSYLQKLVIFLTLQQDSGLKSVPSECGLHKISSF